MEEKKLAPIICIKCRKPIVNEEERQNLSPAEIIHYCFCSNSLWVDTDWDKNVECMSKIGKCVKQTVVAVIEKDGNYWIGFNWCMNPQTECPRKDMPSGQGYEMCDNICLQASHAEVDACLKAGRENCNGATLYLIGHTYCCDNCKKYMADFGIKQIIIGQLPKGFNLIE